MESNADPYRSPGLREPPVTIDFRHLGRKWPSILVGIITLLLILNSHRVELTCEREADGTGFCESRDLHAAWSSEPQRFDLSKVLGAQLLIGKKLATRVALMTKSGVVPLSSSDERGGEDEQQRVVDEVQRFVSGASPTRVSVAYGSRFWNNLGSLFVMIPVVTFLMILTRRVRVIIDRHDGSFRVVRSRFPLRSREEAFELGNVRAAEVEESTGGRGGSTYRIVLIMTEHTNVPLTDGYSGGRRHKVDVAKRINEAIGLDSRR